MAGANRGLQIERPPGDPPEFQGNALVPNWMLSNDELGYQIVLVMQVKEENPSRSQENLNARLPSPIIIGKTVEQMVGTQEARKIDASKENRGTKYLLRTYSRSTADKLLSITELIDGTPVLVSVHASLNTVQGVVYEPDSVNDSEDDILEHLKPQGVTKVRRIQKRVNGALRNTPLLVLSLKGAVLPQCIYIGLLRLKLRTYYPSPLLCYNCGEYGHPKKFCKEVSTCLRCSQKRHTTEGEQCQNPAFCLHCKENHPITSRDCSVYQQETEIIQVKTDNRISFGEARRVIRERGKESYASALQNRLLQNEKEKDIIIKNLRKELETVKAELNRIKKAIPTHPPGINKTKTASNIRSPQTNVEDAGNHIPSTSTSDVEDTIPIIEQGNERQSRKDKHPTSPPKDKRTKGYNNLLRTIELRNRSRSDKRTNTSPPENELGSKGKRRHLNNSDGTR